MLRYQTLAVCGAYTWDPAATLPTAGGAKAIRKGVAACPRTMCLQFPGTIRVPVGFGFESGLGVSFVASDDCLAGDDVIGRDVAGAWASGACMLILGGFC